MCDGGHDGRDRVEGIAVGDERAAGEFDRRLGERVRARRLAIGMSQEHLADLLGLTFQQVQKYERGINRIAASRLTHIAAALEVPITHFFEGLNRARRGSKGRAEDTAELLRLFASIEHDKDRRRVLEFARSMAQEKS